MNTTPSVAEILTNTKQTTAVATGINNLNTTATDNCTPMQADELFVHLQDLVNPQFKAWYCQQFHGLTRTKVIQIAAQAKADGKDPRKLFSFLLKNA